MTLVTGDRYLESLVKFVENHAESLIEGTVVLKLNPVGLHFLQSRLEALAELESLLAGAPVDYLRAYVSDLGDHRALEQLRRILRLLPSLKVVSVLPPPTRDPTPLSLLPFNRLKVLELRGCDLSTSAAKGLLELRHTLEKLICHNSTDALRHVFASRIAEIKESPLWNRLSFVSCACNGLVLMDESLQLLPAVETLDLSRNKFAKVDNIRKCTKLKHFDLGFNNLRSIGSLSQVTCQLVKLVLRNNALTTLRGIENLKSLEGLDLSYNLISNFSEIEILAGLSSLQSLWLEGNPVCCARWYRSHVFSFFPYPERLKLDEKGICTREFWERQIVIASRQKRPASFGFYSPARNDAGLEGTINTKRQRLSRVVSIESEEQSTYASSDQDAISFENDTQSKEENIFSGEETEVVDLMSRIEEMKKERSVLWLQEFKEWISKASDNNIDGAKNRGCVPQFDEENHRTSKRSITHQVESSRLISDSIQTSGSQSSSNALEADNSFVDTSVGFHARRYFDRIGEAASKFFVGETSEDIRHGLGKMRLNQEHLELGSSKFSLFSSFMELRGEGKNGNHGKTGKKLVTPLAAIDNILEPDSSSAYPGSPPHYQKDILHRRQNLEEEFLQLSAESLSVASTDSNTSCSEDDSSEFGSFIPRVDQSSIESSFETRIDDSLPDPDTEAACCNKFPLQQNGMMMQDTCSDRISASPRCRIPVGLHDGEIVRMVKQEGDWLDKKNRKKKDKRRVILLSEDKDVNNKIEPLKVSNGNMDVCRDDTEDKLRQPCHESDYKGLVSDKNDWRSAVLTMLHKDTESASTRTNDFIENFFNSNVADAKTHEICKQYVLCSCFVEERSGGKEREVAVLLSSEHTLYMLNLGTYDGSGNKLELMGCHGVGKTIKIFVGLGLLLIRIYFEDDATYLFTTRNIEISRQLLHIFHCYSSNETENFFSLISLEQVQVELFERHICEGSRMSIFQYSMVFFCHNNLEEGLWRPRSLFVAGSDLFVCIEDFMQFGPLSEDASSYFSLDFWCSIATISEIVVENAESPCVTLVFVSGSSKFRLGKEQDMVQKVEFTWKLKWFSEEDMLKFVALLKAIRAGTGTCSS